MIRRFNGDYISYINNQKVCLKYLNEDVGELFINEQLMGKCSFSYAKESVEKIEGVNHNRKLFIEDDELIYKELQVGTLINIKA